MQRRLFFLHGSGSIPASTGQHKTSPYLRSHLELYKRRKTRELNKRSVAEVEFDSIPNSEQRQENAPDSPAPAVENPAPKPPSKAHFHGLVFCAWY